ncbi:protein of unknown function [Ruminococcaceae bacterium BL-6]|nr:protein of unknown function [Ruminococcaceae bacterium BL-6]
MIHIEISNQAGEEKFKEEASKILKQQLRKGWKLGVQASSKIILKKLEGVNEENYKDKISDVKQFCEWSLKEGELPTTLKG